MIKFLTPPVVLEKMQRILDRAHEAFPIVVDPENPRRKDGNSLKRDEYVKSMIGMNLGYLKGCIKGTYREPSGRVLKNMGFEIYVKDLETGEFTKVDYWGRTEIDHSDPANPKLIEDHEE